MRCNVVVETECGSSSGDGRGADRRVHGVGANCKTSRRRSPANVPFRSGQGEGDAARAAPRINRMNTHHFAQIWLENGPERDIIEKMCAHYARHDLYLQIMRTSVDLHRGGRQTADVFIFIWNRPIYSSIHPPSSINMSRHALQQPDRHRFTRPSHTGCTASHTCLL